MKVYNPQPARARKRLPRRAPVKVIPSMIGEEGLVGCWLFYRGSGTTIRDNSPEKNHGSLQNGPVWRDGPFGWSVDFDYNQNQYVNVPHDASLNFDDTDSFTILAWHRPETDKTDDTIISKNRGGVPNWWFTSQTTYGNYEFQIGNPDVGNRDFQIDPDPTLDRWNNPAVRHTPSETFLYHNGTFYNSDTTAFGDPSNTHDVWIAADPGGPYYHDGPIAICIVIARDIGEAAVQRYFEETRGIFGV